MPELGLRIYVLPQNITGRGNSIIRIIENEISCLITYPFIHIMFSGFHKLRKRIAHGLLGGRI